MNKSIIYLLYFTLYTVILLWYGKGEFKKVNNRQDFFVAGNSLGVFPSILTFTATWFSAASMQGLSGSIYAYGYAAILYSVIPWFMGAAFLLTIVHRLKKNDILTVPEYFKIRYNSNTLQVIGGCIIILTYTFYIIIQIRGFGVVMSELLDINYTLAIVLIYLFIIYTTFGGLLSVTKTDKLNFALIALGIVLATVMVLKNVGGITVLNQKAAQISTKPFSVFPNFTEKGAMLDTFSKGAYSPLMILNGFCGWGLGVAANPQYAMRIISAKDTKSAVKMICFSVLILSALYTGIAIIGVGSRVLQPSIYDISSVDEVFPYIINKVIYSSLSGIVLIGITAAAVSTANSQLLILASGFSYDIFNNFTKKNLDEDKFLNLNRIIIIIFATISLLLSINPPESLLIYGNHIWGIFSVTFLLPLYGGLFWEKATKQGAISSIIGGIITIIIFTLKYGLSANLTYPILPGIIVASVLFYSVSKFTYIKR